jgi:N-acylneuraminate cytidylyltransferase
MSVIGIIPARKNSKRLPGKNTINLAGKPLIEYTFESASGCLNLDRIILTTDDPRCIEIAHNFPRIEVPFTRPDEISNDKSTDLDVFQHVLNFLLDEGDSPQLLVHLRPTSPLRTTQHIDLGVEMLRTNPGFTSLRSVAPSEVSIFKLYNIIDDKLESPIPGASEFKNHPDQLLPKTYRHVGYVDIVWSKTLIQSNSMTGDKIMPYIIADAMAGINSLSDLKRYEAKIAAHS